MKILLVRPDGIGDEVLSLPVAGAVRKLIPAAHIAFLSSPHAAPIFEHLSEIDEVLTATHHESLNDLIALFKGFDAAVFLKPFRRLMLAAFCARVPLRVASGYRWYSFLANRRVYQHRRDFSKHESVYNIELLTGLGLSPGVSPSPKLVLTSKERHWAEDRLNHLPSKRVVLHPGGLSSRRWKSRHYLSLANQLVSAGYGIILTGNEQEHARFTEELSRDDVLDSSVEVLMGQLTLRELMAVIGVSGMVVSGSTGPAHLAAGLGVKTVSIFDPRRNQLPVRWGPLGQGVILRPEVPICEKCSYEACPYWDCLDRISVSHVIDHVQQVFEPFSEIRVVQI